MAQSSEPFGYFEPSTPNAFTKSFERLTLKRASSSHGSSSSVTLESSNTSYSSRPSVSDSGRRKSSLSSFSSRLKKSKTKSVSDRGLTRIVEKRRSGAWTLGQHFFYLPAEIQTAILAYLDNKELLALRTASKESYSIFQANGTTIARNAFLPTPQEVTDSSSPYVLIDLFPSTFASTTTDAYLLRSMRREVTVRRQLKIVLAFVQFRSYMMRLTRDLPSEQFAPYRDGLAARLFQPLCYIQHYFETIRHLVIFSHPEHLSPRLNIDQCPSCMNTLKNVVSTYPDDQLVAIYQTIQLLIQHFRTATRSPSSVSIFERKLKGWGYGPPPEDHMSQLVLLGCIQELSKIDEMQGSYGKRIGVVKQYTDMLDQVAKINSLTIPDFYQTGTDPVMAMAMAASSGTSKKEKRKSAERNLGTSALRRDKENIRTAIEARADEVKVTKSLDARLDKLTEAMVATLPRLDRFLVGADTILGKRIMALALVDHERELVSPYGWVTRLMGESYRPDSVPEHEEQS